MANCSINAIELYGKFHDDLDHFQSGKFLVFYSFSGL